MAEARPLDWAQLMRLGMGVLRLGPDAFWAMTPMELVRALEGAGVLTPSAQRLGRDGLERLMAAYPAAPGQGGPETRRAPETKGETDGIR